jgi:hypothetical protein
MQLVDDVDIGNRSRRLINLKRHDALSPGRKQYHDGTIKVLRGNQNGQQTQTKLRQQQEQQ